MKGVEGEHAHGGEDMHIPHSPVEEPRTAEVPRDEPDWERYKGPIGEQILEDLIIEDEDEDVEHPPRYH